MQRQNIIDAEAGSAMLVQLACSSLCASGSGLFMYTWLNPLRLSHVLVALFSLSCSLVVGILTTANIIYDICLLSITLRRLAAGKSIHVSQSFWLWPLNPLFRILVQAHARMDTAFQHEQRMNEYHDQLLQQASEAAAAEERNHLARDLHDSIKQQIFSIRMSAVAARAQMQTGMTRAEEALEDILRSSNEAQVEMQALLLQLRSAPLEHTNLPDAIHTQARALEYRSGVQVSVEMADLPESDRLPLYMQEVLFRIVQEAFANIARHARAQYVFYVQTQDETALHVSIRDDGQGFDFQAVQKGMGLGNIQERARSLNGSALIESQPGKGTTLRIQIPLLVPPEVDKQKEQDEYIKQDLQERASSGLRLRSVIAAFTLAALITNLSLFTLRATRAQQNIFVGILLFCLLLMTYGLVSAQLAIMRLRHYREDEDQRFHALVLQLHLGWSGFLRLVLVISWEILLWGLFLPVIAPHWLLVLILLFMAGCNLALLVRESYQLKAAQQSYYPLLSHFMLELEVRNRWRDIRLRVIFCICFAITLIMNNSLAFLGFLTLWQWLQDYLLLAFLVIFLDIVVDIRRLTPWSKRLKPARERV